MTRLLSTTCLVVPFTSVIVLITLCPVLSFLMVAAVWPLKSRGDAPEMPRRVFASFIAEPDHGLGGQAILIN